jgi:hypothetical protein
LAQVVLLVRYQVFLQVDRVQILYFLQLHLLAAVLVVGSVRLAQQVVVVVVLRPQAVVQDMQEIRHQLAHHKVIMVVIILL